MISKLVISLSSAMCLLLATLILCVGIGTVHLPFTQITMILIHQLPGIGQLIVPDWDMSSEQIIVQVRLPRVLLTLFVGSSLAAAGAAFQGVLRNPLADPYTLGVASGSSVGAAVLIFAGWQYSLVGIFTLPLVAFLSGLLTLWIVIQLSSVNGKLSGDSLILSGVIVQAFLGAIVTFLMTMSKQAVNEILYWTLGGFQLRGWPYIGLMLPYLVVGAVFILYMASRLNLLALGEREAAHTGLNVEQTKLALLVVATLMTATAVSVSGVIGFVGLIVPHMMRLIVGSNYKLIVPLSILSGGIFMMWCDLAARTIIAPSEIPIGVVTAFIGAPFFAYLLYRNKRRRGSR